MIRLHPVPASVTSLRTAGRCVTLVAALCAASAAASAGAPSSEGRVPGFLDLPRSEDDRGFSIVLLSPSDLFLTGRHTLHIEAIIPRGDAVEQVDFFLDGRLLATDRKAPYQCPAEFGGEIRRHTIEIRATTREGRRAKVSVLTRSGDISEGAVARILAVPVVARRPTGELIDDLGVSEIAITEDGEPRPIAYFAAGPFPASIAVVAEAGPLAAAAAGGAPTVPAEPGVHATLADPGPPTAVTDTGSSAPGSLAAGPLAGPLAAFLRALPAQDSTALVEGAFVTPEAAAAAFSFDPAPAVARVRATAGGGVTMPWQERVRSAAQALGERRGLRILVVVLGAGGAASGRDLLEDPAAPALESALESGATVYAVVVGAETGPAARYEALGEAADRSGGAFHAVSDSAGLDRVLQEIGAELRYRAVAGFIPVDEKRPGWRAVQVAVRGRDAVLRAPRSVRLP